MVQAPGPQARSPAQWKRVTRLHRLQKVGKGHEPVRAYTIYHLPVHSQCLAVALLHAIGVVPSGTDTQVRSHRYRDTHIHRLLVPQPHIPTLGTVECNTTPPFKTGLSPSHATHQGQCTQQGMMMQQTN